LGARAWGEWADAVVAVCRKPSARSEADGACAAVCVRPR
jgi:hypothetical protein